MPKGKYVEKPRNFQVFKRLMSILDKKFDRQVLVYPKKDESWQSMVIESNVSQELLVLREDYRLYRICVPANYEFQVQEVFSDLEREV